MGALGDIFKGTGYWFVASLFMLLSYEMVRQILLALSSTGLFSFGSELTSIIWFIYTIILVLAVIIIPLVTIYGGFDGFLDMDGNQIERPLRNKMMTNTVAVLVFIIYTIGVIVSFFMVQAVASNITDTMLKIIFWVGYIAVFVSAGWIRPILIIMANSSGGGLQQQ